MNHIERPHKKIIETKFNRSSSDLLLKDVLSYYSSFVNALEELNSEKDDELREKVRLLNEYKNYIDEKNFRLQDKIGSSVIEEFLYFLFKDIPEIKTNLNNQLIFLGQTSAYMDLSFAPKNFQDFILNAGVYVNKKNQDFTISKIVKCKFINNGKEEKTEFTVPTIAIECKTFIPSTMLGQSDFEAQKIKQGNPFSLYVIIAEQNALSENVMLKNSKIDEIFILRKQKRNATKNLVSDKKPIDFFVIKELYEFVKEHLRKDWFNSQKATQRGRLIKF